MDFKNFTKLKKLYAYAVEHDKKEIRFQGQTILTVYAKYLIEYLTPKFKNHH
jgi:hypothetical protein